MGFMHRVKVMLGLADEYDEYDDDYGPDDEYDDDDDDGYERTTSSRSYGSSPSPSPYATEPLSVRRVSREPDIARAREAAPLRAVPSAPEPVDAAPQVKIFTVEPHSFAEAQSIADKFKASRPVIINLTSTDPDLSKRLLDFTSGLTYGLDGGLQKVSDKVFMLTPHNVDLSVGDRIRPRSSSLFGE